MSRDTILLVKSVLDGSGLNADQRLEFEKCISDFEAAWHRQACPNINDYLPSSPSIRSIVVDELLRIDGEFRRLSPPHGATTDALVKHHTAHSTFHESNNSVRPSENLAAFNTQHMVMRSDYSQPLDHVRGGLGDVLVVNENHLGRTVAIKQLQEKWRRSSRARQAFLREVEITSQLEHPGVVPVYAIGNTVDGRPCYAMRYIKGRTLQKAIEEFHQKPDFKSHEFRSMLACFVTVCNTVAFAHSRQIIHRDIKPDNIMLGPFGETLVLDWGLAKKLLTDSNDATNASPSFAIRTHDGQEPDNTDVSSPNESANSEIESISAQLNSTSMPGDVVGTPAYMSPEQASGSTDEIAYSSDIFGLGAVLFAILYGRGPFKAPQSDISLQHAMRGQVFGSIDNRKVPLALRKICTKAMQLNSADRYEDPLALAQDINNWLADAPVTVMRESIIKRLSRFAGRRQTLSMSIVAVLVMLFMSLYVAAQRIESERQLARTTTAGAKEQKEAAGRIARFVSQSFLSTDFVPAQSMQDFSNPRFPFHETVARLAAESETLVAQTFDDDLATRAELLMCVGSCYRALGHFEKAKELLEASHAAREKLFGVGALETLESKHQLARLYYALGDYRVGEQLLRETVEGYKKTQPPQPLLQADAQYTLAWLQFWQPLNASGAADTDVHEAIKNFREVLGIRESLLPANDPAVGLSCSGLAAALLCVDTRVEEAAIYAARAVQINQSGSSESPLSSFLSDYFNAERLRKEGNFNEAQRLYLSIEEQIQQNLGMKHPIFVLHLWNEAGLYRKFERMELAEQTVERIRKFVRDQPVVRSSPANIEGLFIYAEALVPVDPQRARQVCGEALRYARESPERNAVGIAKLESLEARLKL